MALAAHYRVEAVEGLPSEAAVAAAICLSGTCEPFRLPT
jgi:hypothetical protein